METLGYSFELPYPPSLNHYYRHVGSKVMISAKGRKYRETVVAIVSSFLSGTIDRYTEITIDAYPPDRRRRDVDNLLKVLFDSLVSAGLVKDDSLFKRLVMTMREPMPESGGLVHIHTRDYNEIHC